MSRNLLPYGRQSLDDADIAAVVEVLRSAWLTTGPKVAEFEGAVADFVGARAAVAVSSGTAALHTALYAAGVRTGDEVIVPAMTFVATANAVVFQGGIPVFADVHPQTLLIDPSDAEAKITPRTKAIVAVDYAGQPCDYDALRTITDRHGLVLIADACHALGAAYKGRKVGTLADLTVFSFHPVKHITTGEGGMVVTDDPAAALTMRRFRNHGIATDHHQRTAHDTWYYEMIDLGYNYRITDFQCALGLSQLPKLPHWIARRRAIAHRYDHACSNLSLFNPLAVRPEVDHAYHLYVVRLALEECRTSRDLIFRALRAQGIGVNVHYLPPHLHPYYQRRFGYRAGTCPVAEDVHTRLLSIPLFPGMCDQDVDTVIRAMHAVEECYAS
ncbi:MAG: UDP-4-amino-4,6-dideoxy-N-acetyl-beta-L-altrosamine transaminase [Candidatus Binatia bacterium]|nr:UDP-4-amino-4,6-dideoxy-N-acetyl-beta-L-altrosamine transaminase [Candidatus Binatia bacterium]